MAIYGASQPAYGAQVARNTTMYSGDAKPLSQPPVAKNTSLYPSVAPVKPSQPALGSGASVGAMVGTTKTPAPAPLPTAPAASTAPPPAPATSALYDYTTDPVLQQAQAQAQASEAQAQAAAAAAQNQLAIQYSDPAMALDSTYADTARGNPYGVYSLLNYQEPLDQQALDESLNKGNLFYSGARVNQQGQLLHDYGQKRADAATSEQQAYAQIKATLLAAQQQEHDQVLSAQNDAYDRFLQQLLANPPAIGGGTGSGTADTGAPATAGATAGAAGGDGSGGGAFSSPELAHQVADAFYASASTPQPSPSIYSKILAAAAPAPARSKPAGNSAQVRKNSY